MAEQIACYPNAVELLWAQEEPKNMGAWEHCHKRIVATLRHMARSGDAPSAASAGSGIKSVRYVGRPCSASPATGNFQRHQQETRILINSVLGDGNDKS